MSENKNKNKTNSRTGNLPSKSHGSENKAKVKKVTIKPSKYSDEQKKKAIEMVKGGASYYKTGKKIGGGVSIPATVIRTWCLKANVKSKHNKNVKGTRTKTQLNKIPQRGVVKPKETSK